MLMTNQTDMIDYSIGPVETFKSINAVTITGDQLNRAFHVAGALSDARLTALTAYAQREGLTPLSHAAQALVLRMGLVADFLDGPGIENKDWDATMEALARVGLVDDAEALPIGDSGICYDEAQFEELLAFARDMPW